MSFPSITVPEVLIWNSASEVSFTPLVVSFTPVCCQPVVLASGKPHARSVFRQFFGTAGAGGGAGFDGAWLPLAPEDAGGGTDTEAGADALGVHSPGALGGVGVGGGGAAVSFFLHATSP